MKKRIYSKYIVACLSLCLGILILFSVFCVLLNRQWYKREVEKDLDAAARNVNQSITAMMTLTQKDFRYLLYFA